MSTEYFFYRTETLKTTWLLRVAVLGLLLGVGFATRGAWIPAIGRSLSCDPDRGVADAILVDNLESNYLVFERAAALQAQTHTGALVVSVVTKTGRDAIAVGTVELMARVARLGDWQMVPVRVEEPVTLNAALQARAVLSRTAIRSVSLVTPRFRSRRTALVYDAVLRDTGIAVHCVPVPGTRDEQTWAATWHGVQQVTLESLKLAYYRLYVLPTMKDPETGLLTTE